MERTEKNEFYCVCMGINLETICIDDEHVLFVQLTTTTQILSNFISSYLFIYCSALCPGRVYLCMRCKMFGFLNDQSMNNNPTQLGTPFWSLFIYFSGT